MHILALQPNLISRSGPGPRIYFLGLNGLWGARLDAASVAGFGEGGGVAAAAALPGGPLASPAGAGCAMFAACARSPPVGRAASVR